MAILGQFLRCTGLHFRSVLSCLYLAVVLEAVPEFSVPSGYLKKVLKNHTAHACEGEKLGITCPQKTSISILSAFYGRKVPGENFCPTLTGKTSENATCVSVTARQKLLDECKDQRWCQISVNSQMFGQDPCPGTYKYLVVSYKCRPVNYRIKTVCENGTLRLRCRNKSVLTIFSANYGKFMEGKQECDVMNKNGPVIECLAPDALQRVLRQCQKRENCTLFADTATFGEPCFPGVKKQLQVSYICVPIKLLQQMDHSSLDPFTLSDYIYGIPEKMGLYFLCGVSGGLIFLLCIFTPKVTFIQDLKEVFWCISSKLGKRKLQDQEEEEDNHNDDSSSGSSFHHFTHTYPASNSLFCPELTAVLERAAKERNQERDEIWIAKEPSPYAIYKVKSATK
ncbi:protein eva-1 homolog C-like [Globicephala melas]|uniref:protein eva-1 homolog C-like n=1 Tax=Globicephala melas TaxID=9731 RepID=UPI00293D5842|nr:protein eva-1 homolog C-like [Globicephala melas]